MSKGRLINISYSNFKHISSESIFKIDFKEKFSYGNVLLLKGSNGYGKTTLFDAIELLITGRIKNFRDNLSRGGLNYGDLAHDRKKDIIISGEFKLDAGKTVVERVFQADNNFKMKVMIDDLPCKEEDVQTILNMSTDYYDLGCYLSQRESLSFLDSKYNERRGVLNKLLDTSFIDERMNALNSIIERLKDKKKEIEEEYESELKGWKKEKERYSISEKIDISEERTYERLFEDKEYAFDAEKLSCEVPFDAYSEEIKRIRRYIAEYDMYVSTVYNERVESLLQRPENEYKAFYFREQIEFLKTHEGELKRIRAVQKMLDIIELDKIPDSDLMREAKVLENDISEIEKLTSDIDRFRKQQQTDQQLLSRFNDSRIRLVQQMRDHETLLGLRQGQCPLCGALHDDLMLSIVLMTDIYKEKMDETEAELQVLVSLRKDKLQSYEKKFSTEIAENKFLLELDDYLESVKLVSAEYIKKSKLVQNEFSYNNGPFNQFDLDLRKLLKNLKDSEKAVEGVLDSLSVNELKETARIYYNNRKPTHTIEQIDNKLRYITKYYTDFVSRKLAEISNAEESVRKRYDSISGYFAEKIKIIENVRDSYKKIAQKYKKELMSAIKLPVYIFSGKIIQNYPLGLGIYADVDNTKVIFKSEQKEEDVFNVLSTGQLNGLAISILLAIHDVYKETSGIDILLIDDPLQTIDDISAISLADLLAELNMNGQIILSTHEQQKAEMFRYKFVQRGFAYQSEDMEERFFSSNC